VDELIQLPRVRLVDVGDVCDDHLRYVLENLVN
jgi:hypothetical protein